MANLAAYDNEGNQVQLIGTGKSGGEGAIYSIEGKNDLCAKIFHQHKINNELHEKVQAMVNNPPYDPTWLTIKHKSIAWPKGVLYRDQERTQFIGFTMPLINIKAFRESHKYYDSSDRLRILADFTWQHLLTIAKNIASAIGALHEKGHCIGDLRETNILVSSNALITLIDCDSFQVKDRAREKIFYTRVGTGEYLPPEMMSVDFKNQDQDRYYSDLFGLGIIIFKFLMSGFHPYQAKGFAVDDAPSTEAKIVKGYFPYAGIFEGVSPPNDALPYNIIPPSIQKLFYRCFVDGHKEPRKRPTAKEWFDVLQAEGAKLKKCSENMNHLYSDNLSHCPFCELTEGTGVDLFPSSIGYQSMLEPGTTLPPFENRINNLRDYIKMAICDGIITSNEKEIIFDRGSNLQISKKEIEKTLNDEIAKLGKKVYTEVKFQTPELEVSEVNYYFNDLMTNSSVSDNFTISNTGGEILSGSIKTSKKWLKVSQSNIDPTRHKQDIIFNIDTKGLPFGLKDTGIIEVQSNGGNKNINVNITIEIPEVALSRFNRKTIPAFAIILGSIGGLFLEPVGGIMLIIGGILVSILAAAMWGGVVGFSVCLFILAVIAQVLLDTSPLLEGAFGGVLFSIVIGKYIAKPLFKYQSAKNKELILHVWAIAAVFLILLVGTYWYAEPSNPPPTLSPKYIADTIKSELDAQIKASVITPLETERKSIMDTPIITLVATPVATLTPIATRTSIATSLSSDKNDLKIGETWNLKDGYSITAQSIDAKENPRQVWLVLSKNELRLDDKVLSEGETYRYGNILSIKVDSIYSGATSDMARFTELYINPTQTETPFPTTTPVPTITSTPKLTPTATPTPTVTPTPIANSTSTVTPTSTTNSTSTATPIPTTNSTSTATPIPTTNSTSTAAPTPIANSTSTATPTPIANSTSTATPTPVANSTSTVTPIPTTNSTSTAAPTPTVAPTPIANSTSTATQ
ncbi:MAG: S-layer protein domain-containing protein [Candidatus Methanoperedens sp.]